MFRCLFPIFYFFLLHIKAKAVEEKRRPPCQELCGFCFATSRFVTAHRTDVFVYFLFSGSWRLDSCMNISMYLFFYNCVATIITYNVEES